MSRQDHDDIVAASRRCAVALLERSEIYENVIIPPDAPREWLAVVALAPSFSLLDGRQILAARRTRFKRLVMAGWAARPSA